MAWAPESVALGSLIHGFGLPDPWLGLSDPWLGLPDPWLGLSDHIYAVYTAYHAYAWGIPGERSRTCRFQAL